MFKRFYIILFIFLGFHLIQFGPLQMPMVSLMMGRNIYELVDDYGYPIRDLNSQEYKQFQAIPNYKTVITCVYLFSYTIMLWVMLYYRKDFYLLGHSIHLYVYKALIVLMILEGILISVAIFGAFIVSQGRFF